MGLACMMFSDTANRECDEPALLGLVVDPELYTEAVWEYVENGSDSTMYESIEELESMLH